MNSTEEQKKFQALFNQTYSFITMLDNKGCLIEANLAALFYIDRKLSDVKGLYFSQTPWWNNCPESLDIIEKALQASLGGDFKRFEVIHKNRDGKVEYFDYTLKPIFDENANVQLIIAEGRDITKIKHAEQALIESEERLLTFSESTYEGLLIINQNMVIDANNSILRMFGYDKPSDVIGHNLVYNFIKESDHLKLFEYSVSGSHQPFEVVGIKKDGSEIITIPFRQNFHQLSKS